MLTWHKELYEATATDEAAAISVRLWTPDGAVHDPGTSLKLSRREDWRVVYAQVYVLATTTGYVKHGIMGNLVLGLDWPGSWMPLITPNQGIHHPNYGIIYEGPPFVATHGLGWCFYKGALVDTDKVALRILYEPVARY